MTEKHQPGRRRQRYYGAHLAVGDTISTEVPAAHGITAYTNYSVRTACDREVSTVLVTRRTDLVRCPACKTAMQAASGGESR